MASHFITKMHIILHLSLSLVLLTSTRCSTLEGIQDGEKEGLQRNSVKILALFSGTKNDLGLDHTLGRHVLKLAANRVRRLNPELERSFELLVHSDDSDCNGLGATLNKVAEEFYDASDEMCSKRSEAATSRSSCPGDDRIQLNEYLTSELEASQSEKNRTKRSLGHSKQRIDAILGSGCDQMVDHVARMAAYWRVPIFTTTSISSQFARKDIYTTLTRLSPSIDHLSMFLVRLLQEFKWHHIGIVMDKSQMESSLIYENLDRLIERQRYSYSIKRQLYPFSEEYGQSSKGNLITNSSSHCTEKWRETLLSIQRVARVVLLLINDSQLIRRFLLCAYELQMNNGEYTFLNIKLGLKSGRSGDQVAPATARSLQQANETDSEKVPAKFSSGSRVQPLDWFQPDDEVDNLKARRMFESLMLLSVELPIGDEEYQYFVEQTMELANQGEHSPSFGRSNVGPVAVALHDSLLLAIEAIRRSRGGHSFGPEKNYPSSSSSTAPPLLDNPTTDNNDDGHDYDAQRAVGGPSKLSEFLWNKRLVSASIGTLMRELHINPNGDQQLDYVLSDMEPESGQMRPVATYSSDSKELQFLANSYVHWPASYNSDTRQYVQMDEPPPDEPECGFTGEAERCVDRQNLYAALVVISVLLVILAAIGALTVFRYRQIKYQMQLDDEWWKISWSELKFVRLPEASVVGSSKSQFSNLQALDHAASLARQLKRSQGGQSSMVGSVVSLGSRAGRQLMSGANSEAGGAASSVVSGARAPAAKLNQRRQALPLIVAPDLARQSTRSKSEATEDGQTIASGSATSLCRLAIGQPSPSPSTLLPVSPSTCLIRSEYSTLIRAASLAIYKKELVIVKQLNANSIDISRNLLVELRSIRELVHENLSKFVGLCVEPGHWAVVYEYCSRGSLHDFLLNETMAIDWNLKYSIMGDIVNGLNFIHTTLFDYHGRLKPTNLVLDSRFTVKLTDFGLKNLYKQLDLIEDRGAVGAGHTGADGGGEEAEAEGEGEEGEARSPYEQQSSGSLDKRRISNVTQTIYNMDSVSIRAEKLQADSRAANGALAGAGKGGGRSQRLSSIELENKGSARFFWTAPEHLRERCPHLAGSKRGDIYALAMIFFELFTRREPYHYGTTARPRWAVIKKERGTRHQQLQQQRQASTATGGAASSIMGGNLSEMIGRQVRRAQGRAQHRSRGSVGPMGGEQDLSGCGQSAVSARSGPTAGGPPLAPAKPPPYQPVSINISSASIEEADDERAAEACAEPASACSSAIMGGAPEGGKAAKKRRSRLATKRASVEQKETPLDAAEILDQIRMGVEPEPIRPYLPNHLLQEVDGKLIDLMHACWSEMASERPSVGQVRARLRKITKGATAKNYLDNLLERLQSYACQLEQIVDGKSADIVSEKMRTEQLLYQLLPKFVADKLKKSEPIIPQVFDGVTIFFSDIVGFEKYASIMSPCELVDLLNNVYSSFESIISSFDVTKIEVILDQFLVAGGISLENAGQESSEQKPLALNPQEARGDTDSGAAATEAGAKKSRFKRKLDKLRSTTQTSEENDNLKKQQSIEAGQQMELSEHFKRTSAEQVARMALCIRDLVKSFHFRQDLSSSANATAAACTGADDGQRGGEGPEAVEEPSKKQPGSSFVAATFNIRIGIHSGKVCAGIVGVKRPKFCLIGDTVNVASRMHTNSKANRIQVSPSTKELLKHIPGFKLEPRGRIEIKGKGMMETFWLESSY